MSAWLVALLALQGAADEGTLVIREDAGEVAREGFRLRTVQVGEHVQHWKLVTNVRYGRGRPVVARGAAGDVHLWLAPDGRLMKIEIPARHLSVERLPAA